MTAFLYRSWLWAAFVSFCIVPAAIASAVITLSGKLESFDFDYFVINSNHRLYYLSKDDLPQRMQDYLQKNPRGLISIDVPLNAIAAMKPAGAPRQPASTHQSPTPHLRSSK